MADSDIEDSAIALLLSAPDEAKPWRVWGAGLAAWLDQDDSSRNSLDTSTDHRSLAVGAIRRFEAGALSADAVTTGISFGVTGSSSSAKSRWMESFEQDSASYYGGAKITGLWGGVTTGIGVKAGRTSFDTTAGSTTT